MTLLVQCCFFWGEEKKKKKKRLSCSEGSGHCFTKPICFVRPDHFFTLILLEAAVSGLYLFTAFVYVCTLRWCTFSDLHKRRSVVCNHLRSKTWTGTSKAVGRWVNHKKKLFFSPHSTWCYILSNLHFILPLLAHAVKGTQTSLKIPKTKSGNIVRCFCAIKTAYWVALCCNTLFLHPFKVV